MPDVTPVSQATITEKAIIPEVKEELKVEKVEAQPIKEEKPDTFTPRFQEIARREKAIVERERKIKAQEEQFKTSPTDFAKSPKKALEERKITLEQFIQGYLAEDTGKEVPYAAEQKLAEVQSKLDKIEKDREAESQRLHQLQVEENIKQFKTNLRQKVKDNPNYKLISRYDGEGYEDFNGIELACNIMSSYWTQHKEELSQDKALEMAESYLQKLKAKLSEGDVIEKPIEKPIEKTKTLTNHMAPSGASTPIEYLPRDESIAQLAIKLKEIGQAKANLNK